MRMSQELSPRSYSELAITKRQSEIDAIKYQKSSQFGLKHLIRMTHPKPVSEKQKLLFKYILARKDAQIGTKLGASNNPKGRVPRACPWVNE
jgi:hypothetical protein